MTAPIAGHRYRCPACAQRIRVDRAGLLRPHRFSVTRNGTEYVLPCQATGHAPEIEQEGPAR
jgi:hypothetical protein